MSRKKPPAPVPCAPTPKAERYIPGPLEPGSHWSANLPPERLAAFKLPSRDFDGLHYPKDYPK